MEHKLSHFPQQIREELRQHYALKSLRRNPLLYADTSDFTRIDYGDVIHVDNRYYLITGYTREGRFGIDDQPKQWVPKVYDLESRERRILKLVFHETFYLQLGKLRVKCYRSPEKEARVLDLVQGERHFMQGHSALDAAGNLVRVLHIIRGHRLDRMIGGLDGDHQDYLGDQAETILRHFLDAAQAIDVLHRHGLKHGDIRRDHLIIDGDSGQYRWIDFDYDFHLPERPVALDLIGLGNVLLYILGRRNFRPIDVLQEPEMGEEVLATLNTDDLALLSRDRIFNLGKLYPHLPGAFNDILLHFSTGTSVMYDSVMEFCEDLHQAISEVYG